jgi:hypothetical protein
MHQGCGTRAGVDVLLSGEEEGGGTGLGVEITDQNRIGVAQHDLKRNLKKEN